MLLVLCNECKQYEYFVHTIQEYKIQTIQPIRDATPNRDAICPRNSMQQNALDPIIYHTPSIFLTISSSNISLPRVASTPRSINVSIEPRRWWNTGIPILIGISQILQLLDNFILLFNFLFLCLFQFFTSCLTKFQLFDRT